MINLRNKSCPIKNVQLLDLGGEFEKGQVRAVAGQDEDGTIASSIFPKYG